MLELTAAALACASAGDPGAAPVLAARTAFNRAIAEKDIAAISQILSDNAFLITGTDSTIFNGKDAQLETWRMDFADDRRLIYERSPACVTLSPLYPIAMERGSWRGAPASGGGDYISGKYSAKWRVEDGKWRIEAEIYMTTDCGGALCPKGPRAGGK